jgi:hypothetical protein
MKLAKYLRTQMALLKLDQDHLLDQLKDQADDLADMAQDVRERLLVLPQVRHLREEYRTFYED